MGIFLSLVDAGRQKGYTVLIKTKEAVRTDFQEWFTCETTSYFVQLLTNSIPAFMEWEELQIRALCSQTSRFAFRDREAGCHQLCSFGFLARKCKHRPCLPVEGEGS